MTRTREGEGGRMGGWEDGRMGGEGRGMGGERGRMGGEGRRTVGEGRGDEDNFTRQTFYS